MAGESTAGPLPIGRHAGRNTPLTRLRQATAATSLGKWAFQVALGIFAFRHGGTTAVGIVVFAQAVPATLAAPAMGLVADRHPRQRVLLLTNLSRSATLAATAALMATGSSVLLVYCLAVLFAAISTANQPARSALVPSLARTAAEVATTTSALGTIDTASFLVGAGLGGIAVAHAGPADVVAFCALMYFAASAVIATIRPDARPTFAGQEHPARAMITGIETTLRDSGLRLSVGFVASLAVVEGLVGVLAIATAIELLGIGTSGIGLLNIARGAGGVIGGILAWHLLGRRRVAATITTGSLVAGLPLLLVGAFPAPAVGMVAWGLIGAGFVLVRVAWLTVAQRLASDAVLARALSTLEASTVAMTGIGALLAPALAGTLGLRGALVASGALLPLLAVASRTGITALRLPPAVGDREFALVRECPVFSPLPLAVAETVAAHLAPLAVEAGSDVVTEGDPGDRYYIISSGRAGVTERGVVRPGLGPGDGFGEIALLRDGPRTATVTALDRLELFTLDRDTFMMTVTGHADSHHAASEIAARHVGGDAQSSRNSPPR